MNSRVSHFFPRMAVFVVVLTWTCSVISQTEPDIRYASDHEVAVSTQPGEMPFATLHVTSEVRVLEVDDGDARVVANGVARLGEDNGVSEVFTDSTNATSVADVMDATLVDVTPAQDGWADVRIEGWIASESLADSLDGLFEEADATYSQHCTRCHTGYAAPVETLRSTFPNSRVERTIRSMSQGIDIDDRQINLIIQWFQKHPDGL